MREYVQTLFHLDTGQTELLIARSTCSDALASAGRRDVLRPAVAQLVELARRTVPDLLAHVEGIGQREVIATDATAILTRVFLMRRQADLALPKPDAT